MTRPDAYLPDPEEVKKAAGKPDKAGKVSGKAKAESKTKAKPKGGKAAKRGTGKNSAAGGWDGGGAMELQKNADGSYTVGNWKK